MSTAGWYVGYYAIVNGKVKNIANQSENFAFQDAARKRAVEGIKNLKKQYGNVWAELSREDSRGDVMPAYHETIHED
jgi:hypothetical protein